MAKCGASGNDWMSAVNRRCKGARAVMRGPSGMAGGMAGGAAVGWHEAQSCFGPKLCPYRRRMTACALARALSAHKQGQTSHSDVCTVAPPRTATARSLGKDVGASGTAERQPCQHRTSTAPDRIRGLSSLSPSLEPAATLAPAVPRCATSLRNMRDPAVKARAPRCLVTTTGECHTMAHPS